MSNDTVMIRLQKDTYGRDFFNMESDMVYIRGEFNYTLRKRPHPQHIPAWNDTNFLPVWNIIFI